ncbi:MAG: bifunctional DNA-formamidopyrimidine glycosylase/DNA-(apurinic or apyrimidinic site) lyase [Actinobacteria bacterium]|nr:bifunctional DNA-formamidopyrimidine glycosylase/DNA-(apurinic or apyrimidinic site) lyase [Actinomycetota bacterium]
MPELPEVETIRRQLQPLVAGRRVLTAGSHESARFTPAGLVPPATIAGIGRRGKYLLVGLDGGRELVVHLGMTGSLRLRPADDGADGPSDPYVRAWWHLEGGLTLELRDVRRFGRIAVVPAGQHDALPTLRALGPEPFDPAFTATSLHAGLGRSRARVKTQLLGQRVVAGVGNIYADEALWHAGIDPGARRVGRAAAGRLHAALRDVLAAGIANGGTTFRDYRDATGGAGRNQSALRCYGRAGLPCSRCGGRLERRVLDGRGTTWCPACQGGRRRASRAGT